MSALPDPLRALREPVVPAQPDPAFAARLRTRVQRALLDPADPIDPRGTGMTENTAVQSAPTAEGAVGYASIQVPDLARATDFYAAVLGWRYRPAERPDVRHVANSGHEQGIAGGVEHPTTFLAHAVTDLDATLARVRAAGGETGEPAEEPWGRTADCADDQGLRFAVYQPPAGAPRPSLDTGPSAVVYLTWGVPDTARFRAFHGAVFGWTFTPGRIDDGWGIEGVSPMGGVHGGVAVPRIAPMYAVDDVADAVRRVRAAGGTATDPQQMPYGLTSDCTDDQGTAFYLGRL